MPLELPEELLRTAEHLLGERGVPTTNANLRRAWSSIYYALFHFICGECADQIVGNTDECRKQRAWHQVYRAPHHGLCKARCAKIADANPQNDLGFPDILKDFAGLFLILQQQRHNADYDLKSEVTPTDIRVNIGEVRDKIEAWLAADSKHQKAFLIYLLFDTPRKS
jgi:predicted RNA-binding Zn-ribbon protein involved in translation (DUF1610 family)